MDDCKDSDQFRRAVMERYPGIFAYESIRPATWGQLTYIFRFNMVPLRKKIGIFVASILGNFATIARWWLKIPKKRLHLCSFGCGRGWWPLVEVVAMELHKTGGHFLQVKEKFGGLRIYAQCDSEVQDIINRIEKASLGICEECGTTENVTSEGGWVKTLCCDCRKERFRQ